MTTPRRPPIIPSDPTPNDTPPSRDNHLIVHWENDGNITNKAIFLILGSQADILARKDAVRLFEHAVNDYVDRAELTDIFVNFTEVLKASIALKSTYL